MKKLISLLAFAAMILTACAKESASVGVIGGADGPTAVIVSETPMLPMALVVLAAVVLVAVVVVFITNKKD